MPTTERHTMHMTAIEKAACTHAATRATTAEAELYLADAGEDVRLDIFERMIAVVEGARREKLPRLAKVVERERAARERAEDERLDADTSWDEW